ncbi:hypothetical protein JHK84_044858 [Glycine max]|uniref:Dihydroorotate dehydrogenase (Quinone), mitochondrial n=1 Tax=Glycine soja TaxID=3848 RepID=A0A0B2RM89_GLYSO|nr:hypothetical protein JHK86_044748 [Glycine max]KAG4951495.1 hypothetical protein JHK85_045362 [Glycine max]KAG5107951.1 hypothetical protein JHK84_044858 [Glycine max]KHN33183.1 Dihydroorotate dehydrogenase (quinone), mitochondrial [Glycine soja]
MPDIGFLCVILIQLTSKKSVGEVFIDQGMAGTVSEESGVGKTSSTSPSSKNEVKHDGKACPGFLGVNLGKNKTSEDATADYDQEVHTLSQYADYLIMNKLYSFLA